MNLIQEIIRLNFDGEKVSDTMETKSREQQPGVTKLLEEVEKKYNRRISTTTDFEALSVVIEHECGEMISASTLKRLWGYVSSNPTPREGTLDILCRYIGRRDFKSYCNESTQSNEADSSFFSSKYLLSANLQQGNHIVIKWNPNRVIELEYLGNCRYRVISNTNSHLMEGDIFEATSFMVGTPLCIPALKRGDDEILSYIAGAKEGITELTRKEQL